MNTAVITTTPQADKGFYPTPESLGDMLLEGIDMDKVNNVLEPSVGKGNLVRCVAKKVRRSRYGYGRKMEVDCVEIDPYLRSIFMYEFGGQRETEYLEATGSKTGGIDNG